MKIALALIGKYVNLSGFKLTLKRKVIAFLLSLLVAGVSFNIVKVLTKDALISTLQVKAGQQLVELL